MNLPTFTHASILNDLLFLAPSEASLTEVLTQIFNGYSLGSDEQFDGLLEEIPNASSLLFVGVGEFFSKQLNKLIDEVNKGRDEYRDEILNQLPIWAQTDPFIADAPTDSILKRYTLRRQAREIKARKEQKAN